MSYKCSIQYRKECFLKLDFNDQQVCNVLTSKMLNKSWNESSAFLMELRIVFAV